MILFSMMMDSDSLFDTILPIFFMIIIGIIIISIIKGISEWSENNKQPKLTVIAKVVTKRSSTRRDDDHNHTSYYATFEVESGDRLEISMSGREYGMLAEGDVGNLHFQGTRYLGFERMNFQEQLKTLVPRFHCL